MSVPNIEAVGARHIAEVDPVMRKLIARLGPLEPGGRRPRFAALARTIVGQQVSTKAAASIYRKLQLAAGGRVTAPRLAALGAEGMLGAGISRQKAGYLFDLADKVARKEVRLERLHLLDDDGVIERLTSIRGLGEWSAQMFLMFVLHRPDVLPIGDLGIQNGFVRAFRLRQRPTATRMHQLARNWQPYRSIGARYLWRSLDNEPG